ncbi:uncharacterized protein [Danio rerio]|uniref:Uncharacterized protein n=1 Tax=Danio rerio TaxID=7955 RepID=A0AB32TD09_DANRE
MVFDSQRTVMRFQSKIQRLQHDMDYNILERMITRDSPEFRSHGRAGGASEQRASSAAIVENQTAEMQRRGRRKTGVLSFFRKMGKAIHKLCCMDAAATSIVDHTDPSGSARAVESRERTRKIYLKKDCSKVILRIVKGTPGSPDPCGVCVVSIDVDQPGISSVSVDPGPNGFYSDSFNPGSPGVLRLSLVLCPSGGFSVSLNARPSRGCRVSVDPGSSGFFSVSSYPGASRDFSVSGNPDASGGCRLSVDTGLFGGCAVSAAPGPSDCGMSAAPGPSDCDMSAAPGPSDCTMLAAPDPSDCTMSAVPGPSDCGMAADPGPPDCGMSVDPGPSGCTKPAAPGPSGCTMSAAPGPSGAPGPAPHWWISSSSPPSNRTIQMVVIEYSDGFIPPADLTLYVLCVVVMLLLHVLLVCI